MVAVLGFTAACNDPGGGQGAAKGAAAGTLYLNGNVHASVYRFALGSGAVDKLVFGADPFLTPDGTILCKNTSTGDLGEYSADGTTFRIIVKANTQQPFDVTFDDDFHNPQLSPDGMHVAYEGQFSYTFDVYVVNRATGALEATFTSATIGVGYVRPTFTPDGRLVVAGGPHNPGLYVSDVARTTLTRFDPNLTAPDQPAVSPDGTKVAFVLNDHIHQIGLDGTGQAQVTTSSGKESWPIWSPDGKSLALYSDTSILIVPLAGGDGVDLKTLNDNFVTFDSTHDGQMSWR